LIKKCYDWRHCDALRRLGDVHLDVGQGLGTEDVLEEPLRPHAGLSLPGEAGHRLNALFKGQEC